MSTPVACTHFVLVNPFGPDNLPQWNNPSRFVVKAARGRVGDKMFVIRLVIVLVVQCESQGLQRCTLGFGYFRRSSVLLECGVCCRSQPCSVKHILRHGFTSCLYCARVPLFFSSSVFDFLSGVKLSSTCRLFWYAVRLDAIRWSWFLEVSGAGSDLRWCLNTLRGKQSRDTMT